MSSPTAAQESHLRAPVADEAATFRGAAASVRRRYLPPVGDFNGNGHAELLWYRPGANPDLLWWASSAELGTATVPPAVPPLDSSLVDQLGPTGDRLAAYPPKRDGQCVEP